MTGSERNELRIGDVARLAGTTPRTIRYYEEIGLLPAAGERRPGAHRTYAETDVERLTELLRLKDLLGLSLDELRQLDVSAQLKIVRRRRREISALEEALLTADKARRR